MQIFNCSGGCRPHTSPDSGLVCPCCFLNKSGFQFQVCEDLLFYLNYILLFDKIPTPVVWDSDPVRPMCVCVCGCVRDGSVIRDFLASGIAVQAPSEFGSSSKKKGRGDGYLVNAKSFRF